MRARRRADDLSTPRRARLSLGIHYDPEAFGEFSETIARTIGTARFLVLQTIVIIVWFLWNIAFGNLEFDPYPFIFLTLMLSLQAAYAAPLILLAQNRQADRDRSETERDRDLTGRTQSDTEYLARELASIRLALADVVTSDDLREAIDRLETRLQPPEPQPPDAD